MKRGLLSACLLLMCSNLYASSARDVLMDNNIFAGAIEDVRRMPRDELDAFTSYVVTCSAAGGVDETMASFYCERERKLYMTRYYGTRPLDSLITAHTLASQILKLSNKSAAPLNADTAETARRVVLVEQTLLDACAVRYAKLRKTQ